MASDITVEILKDIRDEMRGSFSLPGAHVHATGTARDECAHECFADTAIAAQSGFPRHFHREMEIVTYVCEGTLTHIDDLGNRGNLKSGAVQWMTAGRGIIHSEMPQQENGRMRGFQLWINLPAKDKMKPAGYRDLQASDIPEVVLAEKGKVRVIAGEYAAPPAHGPMTAEICGTTPDASVLRRKMSA